MIFCPPSCPARKPRAEQAEFYVTASEAIFAGFRRCKPMNQSEEAPARASTLLELVDKNPELRLPDTKLRATGKDSVTVRRYRVRQYGSLLARTPSPEGGLGKNEHEAAKFDTQARKSVYIIRPGLSGKII
jgi:AraC family transcriptional regulator, regulatory protein of adaptative response / methylated-DNA-[protein]-cysteine methyltransferase